MDKIADIAKREFNNKWFSVFSKQNVDWWNISYNKHLNMEIILKNIDKPWEWDAISNNINTTIKDYLENPNLPWDLEHLSSSRAFDVGEYLFDLSVRDFDKINRCANVSSSLEHPDLRWNNIWLSFNATPDEINQHPEIQWNWAEISCNRHLTKEFLIQHKDKEWNWQWLSMNPRITIDMVIALLDKPWNMDELSRNPAISIDSILKYKNIAWSKHYFILHPQINVEYLTQLETVFNVENQLHNSRKFKFLTDITTIEIPNDQWNDIWHNFISKNKHITIDFIYANLDKNWDWQNVMKYIDITPELMRDYPNIPWNFNTMSFAKSISFSIIANNLDKDWNWQELSHKFFEKDLHAYTDYMVSSLLVMTIHDFYDENVCKTMNNPTNIERVFLDVYLVRMIEKY
jgi:hypothetical protein